MFAVLQDKTKFKKRAFDGGRPTGPNLGEMAEDGGGDGGDGGGVVPILYCQRRLQHRQRQVTDTWTDPPMLL